MTTLYELAAEHRALAATLADMDVDDQTLADTLEGESGDLQEKAANVVRMALSLEATATAIKVAEAQMKARREAMTRRADWLRGYVLDCMLAAGIKRIECAHFVIAPRPNPPAVEVLDQAQVPARYMRQPDPPPPTIDKAAVLADLKAGVEVHGCRLVTRQRLEIR